MINSRHTNMAKKNSNKETLAQIVNRIEYFNGIHLEVSKINLYEELEFKSRPVCDRLIFFTIICAEDAIYFRFVGMKKCTSVPCNVQ